MFDFINPWILAAGLIALIALALVAWSMVHINQGEDDEWL